MSEQNIFTTVIGNGVAIGQYDVVKFSLTVTGEAKTSQEAKDDMVKKLRPLKDKLNALKKDPDCLLTFRNGTFVETSSVGVNSKYNRSTGETENVGFKASTTISFQTEIVNKTSVIYDALTGIEGVSVDQPSFKMENIEDLKKEALKDAWSKANATFATECEVLGLDKKEFGIAGYQVTYDESQSAGNAPMRSAAMKTLMVQEAMLDAPTESILDIKAGDCKVKVTLTVRQARKSLA